MNVDNVHTDQDARAAVAARGIHKSYGSTRALRGVDLALAPGRCLGLVGRNGAGKSTMVSILSGLQRPDAGEVTFGGEPAPPAGAVHAWRERLATVHPALDDRARTHRRRERVPRPAAAPPRPGRLAAEAPSDWSSGIR